MTWHYKVLPLCKISTLRGVYIKSYDVTKSAKSQFSTASFSRTTSGRMLKLCREVDITKYYHRAKFQVSTIFDDVTITWQKVENVPTLPASLGWSTHRTKKSFCITNHIPYIYHRAKFQVRTSSLPQVINRQSDPTFTATWLKPRPEDGLLLHTSKSTSGPRSTPKINLFAKSLEMC